MNELADEETVKASMVTADVDTSAPPLGTENLISDDEELVGKIDLMDLDKIMEMVDLVLRRDFEVHIGAQANVRVPGDDGVKDTKFGRDGEEKEGGVSFPIQPENKDIHEEEEVPKCNPSMEELQGLNSEVHELLSCIDSLGPVLETKDLKEEIKEIKYKLDIRDKQMVSVNKFYLQVLHSSVLTLSLLHERIVEDDVDKQVARKLYKFLYDDWDKVMDMTGVRKSAP